MCWLTNRLTHWLIYLFIPCSTHTHTHTIQSAFSTDYIRTFFGLNEIFNSFLSHSLCMCVVHIFFIFSSLLILSFSSHTHTCILDFQHPKWHIFSLSNESLYVLGLVRLSVSACDDLLPSISEIIVRMYQKKHKNTSRLNCKKNANSQSEDEKLEVGVRVHSTFLRVCANLCMRSFGIDRCVTWKAFENLIFLFMPTLFSLPISDESGKQRMRIEHERCMHHLFSARNRSRIEHSQRN